MRQIQLINVKHLRWAFMSIQRKEISSVFTPRNESVNLDMYVERPELEKELLRSVKGSMNTLVSGESGNGKSWLYKKVLESEKINYVITNCANASRFGSLTTAIYKAVIPAGIASKTSYSETKKAGVSALAFEAGLEHEGAFEISQDEPLLTSFRWLARKSHGNPSIIVLDNLESIFSNTKLMQEIADIIILLDDSQYAAFSTKFLIVGLPCDVIEYFSKSKNSTSVANRIEEIRTVTGLSPNQVEEIITKGLIGALQIKLSPAQLNEISKHVHHITMGVAQRVHEYCEKLAYKIEDNNWGYETNLLHLADIDWLLIGLKQSYSVIEHSLNSRTTSISRRNQVIYSIGKIAKHQFDSNDIIKIINKEFPSTIPETNMGIGSILTTLSTGTSPLLKRNKKINSYQVLDPRYVMCIRIMLKKNHDEKLEKLAFKR